MIVAEAPKSNTPKIVHLDYQPRGGIARLFRSRDPEILLDGPAGTGKSRGDGEYVLKFALDYPGCRIGIIRKTRVSLTESWMVTWENKVLADGLDRTYLVEPLSDGPGRANRHSYKFRNGSEVIMCGMDNATRLFSTEFDLFIVVEAIEFTENEWESLDRALRNNAAPHPDSEHPDEFKTVAGDIDVPKLRAAVAAGRFTKFGNRYPNGQPIFFSQKIGETNPDAAAHWLNQRCLVNKTKRIVTRHSDNPSLTPEYLERLAALTGVRRRRLFLGEWCTAEGAIWEDFDHRHMLDGTLLCDDRGRWSIAFPGQTIEVEGKVVPRPPIALLWFFCSIDWGFRKPGVLQVWGVDAKRRAYRVREWYCTGRNTNWWAERAADVQDDFDPQVYVCDSADQDSIDILNKRLWDRRKRNICLDAIKGFEAGANVVRDRLAIADDGLPRVFFLRGALVEKDPVLVEKFEPTCTEQEIPGYVYERTDDGKPLREKPDQMCPDHGCDALRYGMMWLDYSMYEAENPEHKPRPGTADAELGISEFLERAKAGEFQHAGTDDD